MKAQLNILDSQIFSKVANYVVDEYGGRFSMTITDNFSSTKNDPTGARFPFVYVGLINASENSTDLERSRLNGGLYTYQVNVYDNTSQAKAKQIMDSVVDAMKQMSFTSTSLPINASDGTKYMMIARFQRFIDEGDTI